MIPRQIIELRIGCPEEPTPPSNAKPPLQGLCLRQHEWMQNMDNPDLNFYRHVNSIVIRVYMKHIWVAENRFEFGIFRDMFAWGRKMQAQHGIIPHFKIRIVPGAFAPDWLMTAVGKFPLEKGGYETTPGFEHASDYCPMFWTSMYLDYWEQLMQAISAEFDDEPLLSEVTVTATAPGTGEPMIFGIGNSGDSQTRLRQYITAGATSENILAAIYRSIDIMDCFARTNIGIPLTEYQHMVDPTFHENETSYEIGNYMAEKYRSRCVLGNNGLRVPESENGQHWIPVTGRMWQLQMHYIYMKLKYGSRIYNQTASENQMGGYENLIPTLNAGLGYLDGLVELPGSEGNIKQTLSPATLALYNHLYRKNEPN